MEKQSKNKISKFLSKALSFQNPPFSPAGRRDNAVNTNNLRSNANRGFSGPIVSMIPAEVRGRKSKNANLDEPTSPKVSCMGQIKIKRRKNKIGKKERVSRPVADVVVAPPEKKAPGGRWNIFSSRKPAEGRRLDGLSDDHEHPVADSASSAPSLNQMKKFSSSRETFANFDWATAQIAPEEGGSFSDGEGEDEVIIPFSAPILFGGRGGGDGGSGGAGGGDGGRVALQPRKEINIWKRRTMTQPKPLQLD